LREIDKLQKWFVNDLSGVKQCWRWSYVIGGLNILLRQRPWNNTTSLPGSVPGISPSPSAAAYFVADCERVFSTG
jgi:hypothetical protein